ncbi:hypothetical protein ONZ45_g12463 [Pleurotus djamor]|nr:hypothetical protein ONZ45_g12463 [Pleurotus djamor]
MCMWDGPDGEDVKRRATWAQSGMVVDALRHATDSLDYLRLLKNQSAFNFCAIPQTMAMATLELCFMNSNMFQRNVKIRKAEAASLIMRSTNPREVAYIFRDYARRIHTKASPADPNFLRISVACGKIEQWCEHHYPSFVTILQSSAPNTPPSPVYNESDARARIVRLTDSQDKQLKTKEKAGGNRLGEAQYENSGTWEIYMYAGGAMAMMGLLSLGIVYTVLYFA